MATDIEMYRGESVEVEVAVVDQNGDPVALTDCTIVWKTSTDLERSTTAGTITIDGNVFRFALAPTDTRDAVDGTLSAILQHEAKVTSPAGRVKTVLRGTLTLKGSLIDSTVE